MRIALTGGIACGKSLLAKYLNELGVETIDADDIVHEIIPADERHRIADEIFRNPSRRKELEARIHPIVREKLAEFADRQQHSSGIAIEIIPLLFECHWEEYYDIIVCVFSPRSLQVERMISKRGYSEEQAEARLSAQIPVEEKVSRSDYVVENCGSAENLEQEAKKLVDWLKGKQDGRRNREEARQKRA
jgi:dephospho-CoA kinase